MVRRGCWRWCSTGLMRRGFRHSCLRTGCLLGLSSCPNWISRLCLLTHEDFVDPRCRLELSVAVRAITGHVVPLLLKIGHVLVRIKGNVLPNGTGKGFTCNRPTSFRVNVKHGSEAGSWGSCGDRDWRLTVRRRC